MSNETNHYFISPEEIQYIELMPGVKSRILTGMLGEKMMMVLTTIEPGATVPSHAHPHEQIGMVFSGKASFRIDDEEREVSKGDFFSIPANVDHEATCISAEPFVALDIFCPVRNDFVEKMKRVVEGNS